jgi:transcriptional regulator with XRE-family HTH domain
MPADRTTQLVYELDAFYRAHRLRQKDLAAELGLSAQALSEILSLRNRPSSETTLRIIEFLEEKSMNAEPQVFTPKPDRPPRADNPDNPATLFLAKERISALNAELARLKGSTSTLPIGNQQPTSGTPKPAPITNRLATPPTTAWEKEAERARADLTAGLSSQPLAQQSVGELRAALNVEKDDAKRTQIYKLIRQRKEEASLSTPRAKLRGA